MSPGSLHWHLAGNSGRVLLLSGQVLEGRLRLRLLPTFVQGGQFQGDADDSNQVFCGHQGAQDGPDPNGFPFPCLNELSHGKEIRQMKSPHLPHCTS